MKQFTPDYTNILKAASNIEAPRLPVYEHLICEEVMEFVLNRKFMDLKNGDDKDLEEYFRNYCEFFKTMGYDTVSFECCIGSAMPGSHFLETIATEAEAAAQEVGSSAVVTLIDETGLDEDGYINLDTAKALLANQLGVETLDAYYGSDTPTGDSYICTVEAGGIESSHSIDAITGLIADATEEELLGDVDGYEETEYYDYEQEFFEEEFYDELIEEEPVSDETVTTPESTQTGA